MNGHAGNGKRTVPSPGWCGCGDQLTTPDERERGTCDSCYVVRLEEAAGAASNVLTTDASPRRSLGWSLAVLAVTGLAGAACVYAFCRAVFGAS